jgi:hypothetical protein
MVTKTAFIFYTIQLILFEIAYCILLGLTFLVLVSDLLNSSSDTPLVSGMIKATKRSCKNIINAKNVNTIPGPIVAKRIGINEGTTAARIQCTELPKLWPYPLK